MKHSVKIAFSSAVLVAFVVGGWWAYRDYRRRQTLALIQMIFAVPTEKPSWKRRLPPNATEVHEFVWADGFLPDYACMLKARVTAAEFEQFIAVHGLTPNTPERKYSEDPTGLTWSTAPGFKEEWWDVSPTLDHTFVREGHHTWTFAKYENGFLYWILSTTDFQKLQSRLLPGPGNASAELRPCTHPGGD